MNYILCTNFLKISMQSRLPSTSTAIFFSLLLDEGIDALFSKLPSLRTKKYSTTELTSSKSLVLTCFLPQYEIFSNYQVMTLYLHKEWIVLSTLETIILIPSHLSNRSSLSGIDSSQFSNKYPRSDIA